MIETYFDTINRILDEYRKNKEELEKMESFFQDMLFNPSSFPLITPPITNFSCFTYLKVSLTDKSGFRIYNELEALYNYISKNFSPSLVKNHRNIKIAKVITLLLNQASEGAAIRRNSSSLSLFNSISSSTSFDTTTSPAYSIINSIIEWRGANAHYSLGSTPLNLDAIHRDFQVNKAILVELYKKLDKYLIAVRDGVTTSNFDVFT